MDQEKEKINQLVKYIYTVLVLRDTSWHIKMTNLGEFQSIRQNLRLGIIVFTNGDQKVALASSSSLMVTEWPPLHHCLKS